MVGSRSVAPHHAILPHSEPFEGETMSVTYATAERTRGWLTKVPAITATFWVIKVLSTTIGETFADYLSVNVGLGPLITDAVMSGRAGRSACRAVPHAPVRPLDLLAVRGAGEHRGHADHRLLH